MPAPVPVHTFRVEVVSTNGARIHSWTTHDIPTVTRAIDAAKTSLDIVGEFGANDDLLCVTVTISRRVSYEQTVLVDKPRS